MWKQRDWKGGRRQQNEDNFLLLEPLEGSTFKPPVSIVGVARPPSRLLCISPLIRLIFSQVLEGITSCWGSPRWKLGFYPNRLYSPYVETNPDGLWLGQNPNLNRFFFRRAPLILSHPINLKCSLFSLPPLPPSPTMAKKDKVPWSLSSCSFCFYKMNIKVPLRLVHFRTSLVIFAFSTHSLFEGIAIGSSYKTYLKLYMVTNKFKTVQTPSKL